MSVARKTISFAQQIAIDRHYNEYDYGGNWDPFDRTVGTDCSGCVFDEVDASLHGTAMQWSRNADGGGGSTEDFRPYSMGGGADPTNGPFGAIMVDNPSQYPADAAVLLAFHHGPGGGENSHTWCQVDKLKIETHGSSNQFPNGATVLNDGVNFTDAVLDVHTIDTSKTYGANNWWYIPGPIVEDGTPIPTGPSTVAAAQDAGVTGVLFGVDLSNNNWDGAPAASIVSTLNQVIAEGFSWIEHKVSEGNYFTDDYWPTVYQWGLNTGNTVVGYHYVTTNDASSQAQTYLSNDPSGGKAACMLDFEANSGDLGNYWSVLRAFLAAGINVKLSYVPRWYWQGSMGSAPLTGITGLISSAYEEEGEYASTEYADSGGDNGDGWNAYGGVTPVIWQFTDGALVAGMLMDANAFKGTVSDLKQLLGAGGFLMALSDQQQEDLYNAVMLIFQQVGGIIPGLPLLPGSPTPMPANWPQSLAQVLANQPKAASAKAPSRYNGPPAPPR